MKVLQIIFYGLSIIQDTKKHINKFIIKNSNMEVIKIIIYVTIIIEIIFNIIYIYKMKSIIKELYSFSVFKDKFDITGEKLFELVAMINFYDDITTIICFIQFISVIIFSYDTNPSNDNFKIFAYLIIIILSYINRGTILAIKIFIIKATIDYHKKYRKYFEGKDNKTYKSYDNLSVSSILSLNPDLKQYFDILGFSSDEIFNKSTLNKHYRDKAKTSHSDKAKTNYDEVKWNKIVEAKEVLSKYL